MAEALGLALPHGALAPSGAEIWRDLDADPDPADEQFFDDKKAA